jgi:monovalent cation/hydrogen antiporter
VALTPGPPTISFEPETPLGLFMAPVVIDAAYDCPIGAVRRMQRQLIIFAVFAVVATTALVALIGWKLIGLPVAAAVALGAIVAPRMQQ